MKQSNVAEWARSQSCDPEGRGSNPGVGMCNLQSWPTSSLDERRNEERGSPVVEWSSLTARDQEVRGSNLGEGKNNLFIYYLFSVFFSAYHALGYHLKRSPEKIRKMMRRTAYTENKI